jgi:HAD superfamily hydrolase (TIGR01509 family)
MTIIFDLGNVILPFDPLIPCCVLGEIAGRTAEEIRDLIYGNNLEREFEEGKIDGREFTEGVSRVLGIKLDHDWFHALWADMFTENKDTSALIRRLKPHHPLVLLSNTNEWHWAFAKEKFPIVCEIENVVLSYEIGVLKPHPDIYRAALSLIRHGDTSVFIDDVEHNVIGARRMGIQGILFQSAAQVETELRQRGAVLTD